MTDIDKGPDLAEAPAQSAAGVIRYFPEYLAQLFAPVLALGQSEVSQQGTCLARRRQCHRNAIADHLEFAEDPELQHVAASAAIFQIADLCGGIMRLPRFYGNFPRQFQRGRKRKARIVHPVRSPGPVPERSFG